MKRKTKKEKQKAQGIKTVIDQITHKNDHSRCISADSLPPFTPNAEGSHQSRTPGPEKSVLTVSFFLVFPIYFRWWLTVTWVTYMARHSAVKSARTGGIIRVPFLWLRECILRTAEGKGERTQGRLCISQPQANAVCWTQLSKLSALPTSHCYEDAGQPVILLLHADGKKLTTDLRFGRYVRQHEMQLWRSTIGCGKKGYPKEGHFQRSCCLTSVIFAYQWWSAKEQGVFFASRNN